MKVKIINADCDTWYSDKIGDEFEVISEARFGYYVDNHDKRRDWHVSNTDCEIVAEPIYDVTVIAGKPTLGAQFGISATADFGERTWIFEMPENFRVSAGEFAIIPKTEYEALLAELDKTKC